MQQHILVVEDHPAYLITLRQMLEQQLPDVRVTAATDGSSALRLAQQRRFALILLDYQLPTTSGSAIVRQLRSRAEAAGETLPPIVLMSSQPDVALFARTLGVAAFLGKPVLSEDVQTTIVPLLAQTSAQPRQSLLWRIKAH